MANARTLVPTSRAPCSFQAAALLEVLAPRLQAS
jgi:hypothetical protein